MSDEQEATGQDAQAENARPAHDEQPVGGGTQAQRDAGAWDEVAGALEELGQAVTAWTRALKDDPETRRHARDLKDGFEKLGRQMGDTLDSATDTEVGRSVSQAAGRAGAAMTDAARKAGDQVAPFVISALRGAADGIRRAADGLETRTADRDDSETAGAEPGGEPPLAPPAPEPPATE